MVKKNIVRVNESRLLEIIGECVRRAVNEQFERVNGEGVTKISDVPSPLKRAYLKLDNYGEVSGLSRKQQLELADFCKSNGIECECGCAEYGFFVRRV